MSVDLDQYLKYACSKPRIGFLRCVHATLRVAEDGLCVAGVPCNSFIFLNSATSKRTASNPLGAEWEHEYIYEANMSLGCVHCIASYSIIQIVETLTQTLSVWPAILDLDWSTKFKLKLMIEHAAIHSVWVIVTKAYPEAFGLAGWWFGL